MTIYNDQISQYISTLFAGEDSALQQAREESPKCGLPSINIKPEKGHFLQFLVRASGARKAIETAHWVATAASGSHAACYQEACFTPWIRNPSIMLRFPENISLQLG